MAGSFFKTVFIIVTLIMATAKAGDWNQWRGPNRDGKSDETGLPSNWTPGLAGSENVVWRQVTNIGRESETAAGAQDAGSLVVVGSSENGRVFFMHSMQSNVTSRTICLRENDGAFLWDYVTNVYGGHGFHVCPNHQGAATPYADAANQRLYTGTKEGRLLCLDFDGNLIWHRLSQFNINGEDPNAFGVIIHNCGNSSPVLDGNNVIFPLCVGYPTAEGDPALVALNRTNGNTVWTQNFYPYAGPFHRLLHGAWSIPVVATTPDNVQRIFYQFTDGSVRCLDLSNGQLLWTHEDDSNYPRVPSNSQHPDGQGSEGVAAPVYNPPGTYEVASGAVYVSAGEDPSHDPNRALGGGRLWKLNAQTGQGIWYYASDLGNVIAGVAISENRLYIGDTAGYLHCIDIINGNRIWRQSLGGGEIWSSATVADGKVYIGTQDGDFYILEDSPNFNVLDVDNVGSPIASSVAIANGAIYVKSNRHIWKIQVNSPVPVELASFTAFVEKNDVHLVWVTATKMNNYGFVIERRVQGKEDWAKIAFVSGKSITMNPVHYDYYDRNLKPNSYDYRLKQIDTEGSFKYSGIITAVIGLPEAFTLRQNFPNPFNPTTEIRYQLPFRSDETVLKSRTILRIYNLQGEEVRTLLDEEQAPGVYKVLWDGKDNFGRTVTSGLYFYQIKYGKFIDTKKMILVQ